MLYFEGIFIASGAEGMGFKSRANQISTLCQRFATAATLMCGPWCKSTKRTKGICLQCHAALEL